MQLGMSEAELRAVTILGLVSNGEYSSLFLAQRQGDHEVVVVKRYTRAIIQQSPQAVVRVLREKHAHMAVSQLSHPFLVSYRFSHIDPQYLLLGMENVGGGDVFSLLQRHGPLTPNHARCYVGEVCLALGHLHSFDIMYRDLKVRRRSACHTGVCPRARLLPVRSPRAALAVV